MLKKIIKIEDYSPKTQIESSAVDFLKILNEYSECYFVGGYPRDLLMYKFLNKKNIIKDIDIAIKRKNKKDIKEFFESKNIEYKILNEVFGVYSVLFNGFNFQVASLRKDGKVSNGRRPSSIKFLNSIKKDSKRRDFTMNALYFNPFLKTITDFNGGIKDIKKEKIKFIGKTEKRIKEDYLRILRYIRFKNKYGLISKDKDINLIKQYGKNLEKISKERIKIELDEILSLTNINSVFYELDKFKILEYLLPEIKKTQGIIYKVNDNSNSDIYVFTLNCIKAFSNKILFNLLKKYLFKDFGDLQNTKDIKDCIIDKYGTGVLWSCLFHEIGKLNPEYIELENGLKKIYFKDHETMSLSISMDIMKRYGFNKELKEEISWLIINHDSKLNELLDSNIVDKKKFAFNNNFVKLLILNFVFLIAEYDDESLIEKEISSKLLEFINIYNDLLQDKIKISEIITPEILKDFEIKEGQVSSQIINEMSNLFLEGKIKTKNGVIKYLENKTGKIYSK